MNALEFDWVRESLTEDDRRLLDAYAKVGRPLDDLAYTEDFDRLVREAGLDQPASATTKHGAFKKLLNLRKRGRLPRLIRTPDDAEG